MNEHVTFEIVKHLATFGTTKDGWTKELNIVAWNGREPKYDIREWSKDHKRMARGITLTAEEMEAISEAYYNEED